MITIRVTAMKLCADLLKVIRFKPNGPPAAERDKILVIEKAPSNLKSALLVRSFCVRFKTRPSCLQLLF